jgi:hypothetical protein
MGGGGESPGARPTRADQPLSPVKDRVSAARAACGSRPLLAGPIVGQLRRPEPFAGDPEPRTPAGTPRAPIDAGLANASDTSYIYEVLDSHPSISDLTECRPQ